MNKQRFDYLVMQGQFQPKAIVALYSHFVEGHPLLDVAVRYGIPRKQLSQMSFQLKSMDRLHKKYGALATPII